MQDMHRERLIAQLDGLISLADATAKQTYEGAYTQEFVEDERFLQFRSAGLSFLRTVFGEEHPYYREFDKSVNSHVPVCVERGRGILSAVLSEMKANPSQPNDSSSLQTLPRGNRIFIVHGHNERALQECARFLEKLDQQVVILREQSNKGRTVIEKFEEQSAEVGFAVVLLTADDHGAPASAPTDQLRARARQNVVFELGYFIARLGRRFVCTLYEPGVELPSDYSGVLYEELDPHGTWKIRLARELRDAGMSVDLNKTL
jgi:predicted nucleotide-binding protein